MQTKSLYCSPFLISRFKLECGPHPADSASFHTISKMLRRTGLICTVSICQQRHVEFVCLRMLSAREPMLPFSSYSINLISRFNAVALLLRQTIIPLTPKTITSTIIPHWFIVRIGLASRHSGTSEQASSAIQNCPLFALKH